DHLVVSGAGVFVIDAKNYQGHVARQMRGGWFSGEERLYVGRRDKTSLVTAMAKQSDAVEAVLADAFSGVPITRVICFTAADWPLFARPLRFGDVHVVWADALVKLVRARGPVAAETV